MTSKTEMLELKGPVTKENDYAENPRFHCTKPFRGQIHYGALDEIFIDFVSDLKIIPSQALFDISDQNPHKHNQLNVQA